MRKLLRKQDVLFLGLAGLLDIFEEFRDPGGLVGKSYENMYGFMPSRFKRKEFQHLVWRNLKTENIEKTIKNGEAYLCLTSKAKNKIKRSFPLISLQNKKWDGKWRFIFFDIEEINRLRRDLFREKLKELGFGMLQKSVFISPHDFVKDMIEFLEDYGLNKHIYLIEIHNNSILVGDIKGLADKIWKLEKLNEKYRNIIERLEDVSLTSNHDRGDKLNQKYSKGTANGRKNENKANKTGEVKNTENKKEIAFNAALQEYYDILTQDPFLPKELLPESWLREKAGKMLKEYKISK